MTTVQTHRYLQQFSIKPSMQRTAVMEYLMQNKIHPTIDEIYTALSPMMPTLSKTTVYNKGAVQILTLDEKNARYDVDISKHAHFFCRSCGKVHDIFNLNAEIFSFPNSPLFTINSVEISYSGICNSCKGN